MQGGKTKSERRRAAPDPRRNPERQRRKRRSILSERPQEPPADDAPFDPDAFRERFMRDFIDRLGLPPHCHEKACRRKRRCVGPYRAFSFGKTVACYERRREQLQPIFVDTLRDITASQATKILEDKF
jgi:hypothetical protein